MKKVALLVVSILISSTAAFADGQLQSEKVDGYYRYCYYSDGGALTVGSSNQCPVTNRGLGGQQDIQKNTESGGLVSERVNGEYRYCHYANGAVTTIPSIEICPGTSN
ncbi:hypothetical protein [Aestuariivirga sp.]|uniref:hypothetical protein n=1 Tax=Aestuariivirga sp. TaxID=2650926 RepID=UPI003593FCC8